METTFIVRPEHLNHAGTLFGGYMMQFADECAYMAATLTFPNTQFVTKLFGQFDFLAAAQAGDIVTIKAEVVKKGTTSCEVQIRAINRSKGREVFSTSAVMVNVVRGEKTPIPSVS
jgi:uncharacterized protein (TIGR00369 family)